MVGHICHSLKQTENNVKEELFEDDANYPEPKDATYVKLEDFNEETFSKEVKKQAGLSRATLEISSEISSNFPLKIHN